MFDWVTARIELAVRSAMLSAAGGLLLLAGFCFLTAAGTVALAAAYGTVQALAAVGGGFFLLGLLVMLYARSDRTKAAKRARAVPFAALAEAFAVGLAAAKATRR